MLEEEISQVDKEGKQYQIFRSRDIVDHRWDPKKAVDKADQYFLRNGKRITKKTSTGWDLEVEWKDGSTSWLPLKLLKK
jgi:hypothetical protein